MLWALMEENFLLLTQFHQNFVISKRIIVILIFGLLAIPLWAQPGSTTIIADADEMIKDTPSQTLTLKGSVNVIFQQQHLL